MSVAFVGSAPTAHCGDARTSPPRPQPKSPAAASLLFFRQALSRNHAAGMGSARVPRAVVVVSTTTSTNKLFPSLFSVRRKTVGSVWRDAKHHTPEACAPHSTASFRLRVSPHTANPLGGYKYFANRFSTATQGGAVFLFRDKKVSARLIRSSGYEAETTRIGDCPSERF